MSYEDWLTTARKESAQPNARPEDLTKTLGSGLRYPATLPDQDSKPESEYPGCWPYTRGPYATMYRQRPWTLRQYAGFSTAEESNAFYRQALAGGQTGLSVAFDLATHRGFDSDHPRVLGDVGKAGVAIDTVEDMKILFQDIPLDRVSVSMTMNGAVLPILAAYIVAAEESGVTPNQLSGTIQNDILKEYLVRNTFIYPPDPSLRIVGDIIAFTARHMPRYNSISISGYHMQEAGADGPLELAYTLANGLEYVRLALARGLQVDAFAPRLSFFFGIGMQFFAEISKLRAARRLWAEIMAPFQPKDPKSSMLRTHCQTSGYSLTAQDPLNNIVRTTLEALAAALGGTQSLHTNAYDEAIALPTDVSARIARNTQLILQEETDLCHTADPLGGSFLIESLTGQMVQLARTHLAEISALGGMTRAIALGLPKQRIEACAAEKQARIDRGLDPIVGVNKYTTHATDPLEARQIDNEAVRHQQITKLNAIRRQRDTSAVRSALNALRTAAQNSTLSLLDPTIVAIRARATVGEVSSTLAEVFGLHDTQPGMVSMVYSSALQDPDKINSVRALVDQFAAQNGRRPRILIAKLGQDGHDRGAKVVATGFADLGFDVDLGPLFQTPDEAARIAADNDVHVVGVSTQAGAHMTWVPQLVRELASRGMGHVIIVVGGIVPPADHDKLLKQGVTRILGPGTAVFECAEVVLRDLLTRSPKGPQP